MKVTPLAAASREAVRAALRAGGFEEWKADAAAQGTEPAALLLSGLDAETREALVAYAGGKLGLDVLTTDSGALISGSRATSFMRSPRFSKRLELVSKRTATVHNL